MSYDDYENFGRFDAQPGVNPLYVQAVMLSEVVKRTLKQKANIDLSQAPSIKTIPIVAFMKKMRVSGMDKFNGKTYIATVNFYDSKKNMEKHKSAGIVIVYMEEKFIPYLLKQLGYPDLDNEDKKDIEDAIGTFCNLIAAKFKQGIIQLGYIELEMSHFSSYENDVPGGVEYDLKQNQKYEISFDIKGIKRIVVDFTMAPIAKAKLY